MIYKSEETTEAKRKRRFPIVSVILAVLLIGSLTAGYYLTTLLRDANDKISRLEQGEGISPQVLEKAMEAMEGNPLSDGRLFYGRDTLRAMSDDAVSLTEMMSMLFPENIVYYNDEDIVYLPISPELKKTDFDPSCLSTDPETGRKTYTDKNGSTALLGIDVSEWQGSVDWEKVKADGISFAFLRAGLRGYESGTVFTDEYITANLKGANDAGVPVGIYFYTQAINEKEAVEEAETVLELIKGYDVSWPIVIDIESASSTARTQKLTPAQRTDIVIAFCDRIEKAGYTPMVYTYMRIFAEKLELERLERYDKWFAQYFSRPYYPYAFSVWQFSDSGSVAGIRGAVDLNLAFRDYSEKD